MEREHWKTKFGLILAMAGNAIGLGNFLRFPTQVAANGGGAYLIPYFISLLLLGLPMMWLEWAMGRYGGARGHGSAPGILWSILPKRISIYLGVIGLFVSFTITVYYTYIESWSLSYAVLSFAGKLPQVQWADDPEKILKPFDDFFKNAIGDANTTKLCLGFCIDILKPSPIFYFFFVLTFLINLTILGLGISKGIERFALFAMPTLFFMAVLLVIRVFTLDSPLGISTSESLAFIWEPNFEGLKSAQVWISAAGQVFFTLSIGISIIMTYASYVREKDDIALSGLATASFNEFAEVVLGASIAIPAAVMFFGVLGAEKIASEGAFRLAFYSTPAVFEFVPFGNFFAGIWFFLLFFAGVTSSIALAYPFVSFLEDEFGIPRRKTVLILGVVWFILSHIPIFVRDALNEMDFWAGTLGLVVFALIEVIYFTWIMGVERAWQEIMKGAKIYVPKAVVWIMKYISLGYIIVLLVFWSYQNLGKVETDPNKNFTRILLVLMLVAFLVISHIAFERKRKEQGVSV